VIGDPERSYANWTALRASWPDVVPAVHCGSDLRWVTRYIQDGAHRIAFGGLVPHALTLRHSGSPARQWLDAAFAAVHGQGVAVHGYGISARSIVLAYPWTTTDSSSAVAWTRFRRIQQVDGTVVDAWQTGWADADVVRTLADPWEVRRGSRTRRSRLMMNLTGVTGTVQAGALQTFYHAISPRDAGARKSDFDWTVEYLLQNGHGA
jgi:hypothetical protein